MKSVVHCFIRGTQLIPLLALLALVGSTAACRFQREKKSSDPRSRYHRRLVFFGLQLQPKRVQTQFVKWPVITAEVMIRQQVGGGRRSVRPKLKMDGTPPPPPLRRPKDTWSVENESLAEYSLLPLVQMHKNESAREWNLNSEGSTLPSRGEIKVETAL